MSILENIKARIITAMRQKDEVLRDSLKMLLGEVQTNELKDKKAFDDSNVQKTAAKICAEMSQTIEKGKQVGKDVSYFEKQVAIISEYSPKFCTIDAVRKCIKLEDHVKIKEAKEGPAFGIVSQMLKKLNLNAMPDDVKMVIHEIKNHG
jgi:uncharacterized protein YqeY